MIFLVQKGGRIGERSSAKRRLTREFAAYKLDYTVQSNR